MLSQQQNGVHQIEVVTAESRSSHWTASYMADEWEAVFNFDTSHTAPMSAV